jgi:hypothetical protein
MEGGLEEYKRSLPSLGFPWKNAIQEIQGGLKVLPGQGFDVKRFYGEG